MSFSFSPDPVSPDVLRLVFLYTEDKIIERTPISDNSIRIDSKTAWSADLEEKAELLAGTPYKPDTVEVTIITPLARLIGSIGLEVRFTVPKVDIKVF